VTTTARPYGPARASSGFREIDELHDRIDALQRTLDTALAILSTQVHKYLTDEVATWGDVPERLARVEDLLAPMSVDPTTPEVEWSYRRGDGILTPAPTDPAERLALITSGVPLVAKIHGGRDDGRMVVLPLPKMEPAGGGTVS
jgi:hypothetical protein